MSTLAWCIVDINRLVDDTDDLRELCGKSSELLDFCAYPDNEGNSGGNMELLGGKLCILGR